MIASELAFSPDDIEQNSTLVAISQSGESADVLEAVKLLKNSNASILSIVNHLNPSLSQESSLVMGLNCGPEMELLQQKALRHNLQYYTKLLINCVMVVLIQIGKKFHRWFPRFCQIIQR